MDFKKYILSTAEHTNVEDINESDIKLNESRYDDPDQSEIASIYGNKKILTPFKFGKGTVFKIVNPEDDYEKFIVTDKCEFVTPGYIQRNANAVMDLLDDEGKVTDRAYFYALKDEFGNIWLTGNESSSIISIYTSFKEFEKSINEVVERDMGNYLDHKQYAKLK